MSALITITESLFNRPSLYEQLAFASNGDSILLIQDAVLGLQSPIALASFLAKCDVQGIGVFALQEDCDLRGIDNQYNTISLVDYAGFVALVVGNEKQIAW